MRNLEILELKILRAGSHAIATGSSGSGRRHGVAIGAELANVIIVILETKKAVLGVRTVEICEIRSIQVLSGARIKADAINKVGEGRLVFRRKRRAASDGGKRNVE